jgi:hypothetical protein
MDDNPFETAQGNVLRHTNMALLRRGNSISTTFLDAETLKQIGLVVAVWSGLEMKMNQIIEALIIAGQTPDNPVWQRLGFARRNRLVLKLLGMEFVTEEAILSFWRNAFGRAFSLSTVRNAIVHGIYDMWHKDGRVWHTTTDSNGVRWSLDRDKLEILWHEIGMITGIIKQALEPQPFVPAGLSWRDKQLLLNWWNCNRPPDPTPPKPPPQPQP